MEKLKSVLYARTSTDRIEQGTSFEQQQRYQDDRFEISKIFDDRSSGTSLKKRKGFLQLLQYIGIEVEFNVDDYIFKRKAPTDIKVIIVSNTSRIARNVKDAQRIIDIVHKQGVKIYFIDINAFSDNEQIEILLNIYYTLDAQYSKDLSRKIKHGMNRLKNNKKYIYCTGAIKGYTLKGGKLTPNKDAEKVINIFNDYINDPTSSTTKLSKKYGWKATTIGSILKNPKYMGYEKIEDTEPHPNIIPLISKELYLQVQEIKKTRTNGVRGVNSNTYALSRKCICPVCGKNMFIKKRKDRGYYDICCNSSLSRNDIYCSRPSITQSRIEKWLTEQVKKKNWRNNIEFRIKQKLENLINIDMSELNKTKIEIDKRIERLLELYLNQEISKELYLKHNEKLTSELKEIKTKIEQSENINKEIEKIKALKTEYHSILDKFEEHIKNKEFEKAEQYIANMYFTVETDILTFKKKLYVSHITFKKIEVIDNFIYLDDEEQEK
ncbi:recombinase family protein [Clostridium paraputrificum]|uniref:recombinase family protein n=1 Tax=Clostridium paraputrificum TaxID=29363 RepID=UPI003F5EDA55